MSSTGIGDHHLNFFIGYDITLYDPDTEMEEVIYIANRGWMTNPSDTIAPHRQYVGLVTKPLRMDFSLFEQDNIGGRTQRTFGEIEWFNPSGQHNQNYIFERLLSVQNRPIVVRMGQLGADLGDMITFTVRGRDIFPSQDGRRVVLDVSDGGQNLDTTIQIDKFKGYSWAVRRTRGEKIVVTNHSSLNPTSAFYFRLAYRIPSWVDMSSGVTAWARAATGGGNQVLAELRSTGKIRIQSRTSADATVTLDATDLDWVKDGRWHDLAGKWDGALLTAFHSTRTGAVKSAITAAQTTLKGSTSNLLIGDTSTTLPTDLWNYVDVALAVLEIDSNVPTDDEIIASMNRPLSEEEQAGCAMYLGMDENTGSSALDDSPNSNTGSIQNSGGSPITTAWVHSFEGTVEMAGKAKPVCFGRPFNVPVTWVDQIAGVGTFHSQAYLGLLKAYEGALRLTIGWRQTFFEGLDFDNGTGVISYAEREVPTGVFRLPAQPSFAGLVTGQKVVLVEADTGVNAGTYTLTEDSDPRFITVDEPITTESDKDYFITALTADEEQCEVNVWHEAGGIELLKKATLPLTAEVLGDMGASVPTADPDTHFPEYTAAIMRRILEFWVGETDINDNWDNGVDEPADAVGSYWDYAGFWVDPESDRTLRDVMQEGGDTIWANFGESLLDEEWNLFQFSSPAGGTPDVELPKVETISVQQIRSVPPIGGLSLLCTVNYKALGDNEWAGDAADDDIRALRRDDLEGKATPDPEVVKAFPFEEVVKPIKTWLRYLDDARVEAQRRYDILKERHWMFQIDTWLYCLDQELLHCKLNLEHDRFAVLSAGKHAWLVHLESEGHKVSLTTWS